jgi:hypothetical protein
MPVRKCSNGKYRIGSGDCIYKSKASAERAYAGYRAAKYSESTEAGQDRRSLFAELKKLEKNKKSG